jgi:transcriptional regulator with XRE-family HTH domain
MTREKTVETITLGKRLAKIRKSRNLIQGGLAKKLGVSRGTVVQYEQGMISPPLTMVHKLADVLDETPEYIAFGVRVQKEMVLKIEVVVPE